MLSCAKRAVPISTVVLCIQVVVVVDAGAINTVLGGAESLSKVLELVSDQLLSQRPGHPTLFSSATKSPWWKLVRKGTAPAFVNKNIRWVCGAAVTFCTHVRSLHGCHEGMWPLPKGGHGAIRRYQSAELMRRHGMGDVVKIMDRVCEQLSLLGGEEALDVNNVTLRISMDVTGIVGFNKDFKTTEDFHDIKTDATIENLKAGEVCSEYAISTVRTGSCNVQHCQRICSCAPASIICNKYFRVG